MRCTSDLTGGGMVGACIGGGIGVKEMKEEMLVSSGRVGGGGFTVQVDMGCWWLDGPLNEREGKG